MKDKAAYTKENQEFLERISQKEGVKALRGGVYYEIIESSQDGRQPNPRSVVTCHYKGSLISGKVFDESFSRSCPESFRVNELISGFQIALVNMRAGDHWKVYIPSSMGYGDRAAGKIPGGSTLIFEIKLISVM